MSLLQLDINDSHTLRDFLRYEELNENSLADIVYFIIDNKTFSINNISASADKERISRLCYEFLRGKEYTDLIEIHNWLTTLKISDISS